MSGKRKALFAVTSLFIFAGLLLQNVQAEGPDTAELGNLAQYYKPVEFDHAMHVEMLGEESCATCHHQTMGTPLVDENCKRCHEAGEEMDSVACIDCHPVDRFSAAYLAQIEADQHLYHVDKPGLKGAYHQRCLGCHKEMDAVTGCQDCHARNDAGDKLFRSGKYAPEPSHVSSEH